MEFPAPQTRPRAWRPQTSPSGSGTELGMTTFAQLVALTLGISLGPHRATEYHVYAGVDDVTVDPRMRLVLM